MKIKTYDIIILGAGVAGLSLARELAHRKYSILLLDEKKDVMDIRYDTAGSFIDNKEWKLPEECFLPIDKGYLFSNRSETSKVGTACIINRKKMLRFLEKEARKNPNLTICYHTYVDKVNQQDDGVKSIVYPYQGREITAEAKIYADCSGINGIIGKAVGLIKHLTPHAVGFEYMVPLKKEFTTADLFVDSNLRGGYGWIFPYDDVHAVIGFGTLQKQLFPKVEEILKSMWDIPRVQERCEYKILGKKSAVLQTGKPLKKFTRGNVVLIGDSASQANPLVGEGIRFVFDASRMAAGSIHLALEKNSLSLLAHYDKVWRKKYYRMYSLDFILQQLIKYFSKFDRAMDMAVRGIDKLNKEQAIRMLKGDISYGFLLELLLKMIF